MAKLSKIFESINEKDTIKQKYFAERIVEHFVFLENKRETSIDIEFIQQRLISEAFKKDSLTESLIFVDNVFNRVDEGILSALKKGAGAIWKGVKKVSSAIKNGVKKMWDLVAVDVIKKWNKKVVAAANNLENLNSSLIVDNSYMLENETKDASTEEPQFDETKYDISSIVNIFTSGKVFTSPKKSPISLEGYKRFLITKGGNGEDDTTTATRILSFGDESNSMIPVFEAKLKKSLSIKMPMEMSTNAFTFLKELANGIASSASYEGVFEEKELNFIEQKMVKTRAGSTLDMRKGNVRVVKSDGSEESSEESLKKTQDDPSNNSTTSKEEPKGGFDGSTTSGEGGFGDKKTLPAVLTPKDDDTKPSSKVANPKDDQPLAPTTQENKDILMSAIDASGIKNENDGFYERMGTTSEDTWNAFDSFAKANGYRISSILKNTNGDLTSAAPMTEAEYLGYIANLKPFLNAVRDQPTQNGYDGDAYKVFLNAVLLATDELSKTVNRSMTVDGKESSEDADFKNNPSQQEDETTKTSDDTDTVEIPAEELIKKLDELSNEDLQFILTQVQ